MKRMRQELRRCDRQLEGWLNEKAQLERRLRTLRSNVSQTQAIVEAMYRNHVLPYVPAIPQIAQPVPPVPDASHPPVPDAPHPPVPDAPPHPPVPDVPHPPVPDAPHQ